GLSARPSRRSGLLFLLLLMAGLCTHAYNAQGAEDDTTDVNQAQALSRACQRVAESIMPTVVRLTKTQEFGSSKDDPAHSSTRPMPYRGSSSGSGVLIEFSARTKSAVILTSYSNVRDTTEVTVEMADGQKFKTADVNGDADTDVGIIRIKGIEKAKVADLGDSDQVKPGQLILAVGHPFGLPASVTMGIISGMGRQVQAVYRSTMIQTDAAANPGSAGGPLLNLDGEVIGVVSAIHSLKGGFDGVTFAVPINQARFIAQQLIQHGRVSRGWLGLKIQGLTPELRTELSVSVDEGVLVADVEAESAAANAGIQRGDIIVAFAGTEIGRPNDLPMAIDRTPIGTEQELKLIRDGKELSVSVVLEEMPL
ncbi:MAG: trypsin-like peptidase domain-containing protein, partial [Deltaproteobacteria bacterium]